MANAGRLAIRHAKLAATHRLRRVPMNLICDEFAFSLAPGGWHPFVALLDDLVRSNDPQATTDFERFFRSSSVNAVRNLNDLLDLGQATTGRPSSPEPPAPHNPPDATGSVTPLLGELPRFWLGTYPWGGLTAPDVGKPGPAFGWAHDAETGASTAELWGRHRTVWYRPDNESTLANERRLTTDLAASMANGYRPLRARGFPRLTILRRADRSYRAVIVDGHHRLAVLAHLGATSVVAEIEAIVDEVNIERWFHVRSGHCSPHHARLFLNAFFDLDGSERFDHVSEEWR